MQSWENGATGASVKKIIDDNFKTLDSYLSNTVLVLSKEERDLLSPSSLKKNLIVFDTTSQKWLKYNGEKWEDYTFPVLGYSHSFQRSSWSYGNFMEDTYSITIPFSEHCTPNPVVNLMYKHGSSWDNVYGGYVVDDSYNITLLTDLPYAGKVVIK